MSSFQFILFILTLVDLALGGLISNGFILTVILREWKKSRSLGSSEQFLLGLVLSNLWASVILIPVYINDYIIPIFPRNFGKQIMYPLGDFLVISRHWFTAWLCVFYCIKIVNSTHSFFLWCKLRISWLVPRFIAGSLVVSLFFGLFMSFFTFRYIQSNITTIDTKRNEEMFHYRKIDVPEILFLIVGSGPPLLMILGCSILVVVSLCRHMYRMKYKEHFSKNLQIIAHVKAAVIILSILFLYLIFYVTWGLC
uniref:Taste receptor type 2 member 40 n=1 Tax=Anolis carolinensis TaxID=28377 RepID=A0A803TUI2_ANOCA